MRLIVSGLNAAKDPMRFDHLFGRYVFGFRPWTHCNHCFVAKQEGAVRPNMKDGSYPLQDRLFYLCGVGHELSEKLHPELARRHTNVHLAVRPRTGSVAAAGSVYGVSFVIEGAQAIPIQVLPDNFQNLDEKHSRCKNFQFCYQMFDVGEISLTPGQPVHRLRERWRSIREIDQDASGCMTDPARRHPALLPLE